MRVLLAVSIVLASCSRPPPPGPIGARPDTVTRAPLALSGAASQPTYRAGEPIVLRFALQAGDGPCLASPRAEGALSIVSVTRDGAPVFPAMYDPMYDEGLSALVIEQLERLDPAHPARFEWRGERELASVAVGPDDRAVGSVWSVAEPGRYRLSAYYELPAIPRLPPDACRGRSNVVTIEFEVAGPGHARGAMFGALFVVGLALAGRSRRGVRTLVLLAVVALPHELATAKVTVQPGVAKDFAKCAAKFNAPGGDPAGVWKATNGPSAKFGVSVGVGSENHTDPDPKVGTQPRPAVIDWASGSTKNFIDCKDPAMPQIARDPCAELYHELSHAKDIIETGSEDAEPCQIGYPSFGDVKAVTAENLYRAGQGLPQRKDHSCKPMPAGGVKECRQTKSDGKGTKHGSHDEDCPEGGCAASNGDPHIRTFDGARYDLQVVGELVMVAGGGDLEIQARQQPFFDSTVVSINTAIAMRVGGHRIGVYATASGPRVLRDGVPLATAASTALDGGASLSTYPAAYGVGYRVAWADGTRAWISPILSYGWLLEVALAPARRGNVRGLFGAAPSAGDPDHKQLADAWRVTAQTSLFDYAAGESVTTFVDRNMPAHAVALDQLPGRAYAEAVCRSAGVTDPALLADCTFDVALTGHAAFAYSAGESLTRDGRSVPAVRELAGELASGGTAELGFDAIQGSSVYLKATAASCAAEVQLYRPDGKELGLYTMLCADPGRVEIPTTGRYRVRVRNGGSTPARFRLEILAVPADRTLAIAVGDAATKSALTAPGEHHRFTFQGTAGQRVTVTPVVPNCRLVFRWYLPDGTEAGLYSFLCGAPRTLQLPSTGRYTIQISGDVSAIGDYGFRLSP